MTKIKVNKLEAARRQIDAAIRMLFSGEDPVAIHTLAWAGFQILRDLDAKQDPSVGMALALDSILRPEKKKEFWCKAKGLSNFLKHADRDAEGIHDSVEEEANDFVLYFALAYYHQLRGQLTLEMRVLRAWLTMLHPDVVLQSQDKNLDELRAAVKEGGSIQQTGRRSRRREPAQEGTPR